MKTATSCWAAVWLMLGLSLSALAQTPATPTTPATPGTLRLLFAGDLMLADGPGDTIATSAPADTGFSFDLAPLPPLPELEPLPRKVCETPLLQEAEEQLNEYFAGARREFDLPLAPKGTPLPESRLGRDVPHSLR